MKKIIKKKVYHIPITLVKRYYSSYVVKAKSKKEAMKHVLNVINNENSELDDGYMEEEFESINIKDVKDVSKMKEFKDKPENYWGVITEI